jgi:ectoine hydroxylase-related dioxygenase (phytanoyl-CoA dioxygenase family)
VNRAELIGLRTTLVRDGAICLRGALDRAALERAQEAYDWSLQHPSPAANAVQGGEGHFYQDLANPRALDAYKRVLLETNVASIVAELWDDPHVWFMYEQVFLKEGGANRRTPWHQDSSYLPVDGQRLAVVWISFDPVAREDSLEFVRASHRGTMYDGSRFDPADDTAPLYGDGSLPRLPNIEAERNRWDIVSWGVAPGDVLVFHPGMLHGGAATAAGKRRRTLSLRFFGTDAVFALRPFMSERVAAARAAQANRQESKDSEANVFAKLPFSLSPGDPFRHPDFMLVPTKRLP